MCLWPNLIRIKALVYWIRILAETDELLYATTALIPPLLNGLEALGYAGRHMHPPNLVSLVESVKPYREPLKNGISAFDDITWPDHLHRFRDHVRESADLAMQSYNEFLSSVNQSQPPMAAYRAMG